jgi:hypothetical protein
LVVSIVSMAAGSKTVSVCRPTALRNERKGVAWSSRISTLALQTNAAIVAE